MTTIGIFDVAAIIAQTSPLWAWAIIANTGNWRICYYVMIAIHCLTVVYLFLCYNPPDFATKTAGKAVSRMQLIKDFDWIGLAMFISGWYVTLETFQLATFEKCPLAKDLSLGQPRPMRQFENYVSTMRSPRI